VRAVWILIVIGLLTGVEPATQLYTRHDVALGLVAPNVLIGALGLAPGSAAHVAGAALCSIIMIGLGILTGYNHTRAMMLGAGVVVWDLGLALIGQNWRGMPTDALFPLVVTVAIRLVFLGYLGSGLLAVGRRFQLRQKMEAADREYEAEQRRTPDPVEGKGERYARTEEDEYQG
jgi:hypothetical protein